MNIPFRTASVAVSFVVMAIPASAQVGSALLNRYEVQQLAAADTAEAHAALAKHFIALADVYRRDAARYTTLANAYVGNPNHPVGMAVAASRMRKADEATANANMARAVVAYHQLLSIGRTSRRPAGAAAFDAGKGARMPTGIELDELARMARTPSAHRELAEYFLVVACTETANAEAYVRTARMTRVSGARNTEGIAGRYEQLAATARDAAKRANLAVELHRQLAAIG
jgi:hypothetical protein